MGHIKDIRNQRKIQSFPSSTYEVAGAVPAAQCTAPVIDLAGAELHKQAGTITLVGAFVGFDLTEKRAVVTAPPGAVGTYFIRSNTDDVLHINPPGLGIFPNITGRVKDQFNEFLTRNVSSFVRHIQNEAAAYTIKGGKLYTNTRVPRMADACPTVFNPLT